MKSESAFTGFTAAFRGRLSHLSLSQSSRLALSTLKPSSGSATCAILAAAHTQLPVMHMDTGCRATRSVSAAAVSPFARSVDGFQIPPLP